MYGASGWTTWIYAACPNSAMAMIASAIAMSRVGGHRPFVIRVPLVLNCGEW